MAKALNIGKLHAPRKVGEAAVDLAVKKISNAAKAEDYCRRDSQNIEDRPKRDTVDQAKKGDADRSAKDQAVRSESADPDRGNKRWKFTIKRPFVVKYDDAASADQDPKGQKDRQIINLTESKPDVIPITTQKDVCVQKAKRKAQSVPPYMNAEDREDDRVDIMNERAGH